MSENKSVKVNFGGKPCEIFTYDNSVPIESMPGYQKLPTTEAQVAQISALFQQMPTVMAADTLQNAYILKWPEGIQGVPMRYHGGGTGTPILDPSTGKIVAHASLYPAATELALTYGFGAMSLATGQYFLTQINQQMKVMNQSIDKILEFLYGDKKAELLSEINFVRYAYMNFGAIMDHDEQRIATLQSLQETRKTAIKDVEFYLADLYSTVYKRDESDIDALVRKAFRIRECLELSIQLYVTGNVLEVYYAQNRDPSYLKYVEGDVSDYISKCEKQLLGDFSALRMAVEGYKPKLPGKKVNKEPLLESINTTTELLGKAGDSDIKKGFHKSLYSSQKATEFCITSTSNLYLKSVGA